MEKTELLRWKRIQVKNEKRRTSVRRSKIHRLQITGTNRVKAKMSDLDFKLGPQTKPNLMQKVMSFFMPKKSQRGA